MILVEPREGSRTHNFGTVSSNITEQLGVRSALEDDLANHLVALLDLLFANRSRGVGRKANKVDVLKSRLGIRSNERLNVSVDEKRQIERRRR